MEHGGQAAGAVSLYSGHSLQLVFSSPNSTTHLHQVASALKDQGKAAPHPQLATLDLKRPSQPDGAAREASLLAISLALLPRTTASTMPPLVHKYESRNDDEYSMTSTSTMDSDYEIPMALQGLKVWSNERLSARLSQTLGSMAAIRESESMRFSIQTATKWKKMGYHPYKPDASGYTALHRAAKRGDASVISSLLAMYDGRPYDLAALKSVKQQQIALHIAAKFGNLEGVKQLVSPDLRPLVNERDRNGNTPLHFAATSSAATAPSIVALLLLRGADPTAKSEHGVFPIVAHVLTAQCDLPEIVHLLVRHGSDPNTRDTAGNTVLHIAVSQGLWHIAAALVREGANMTIKNKDGVTVLDMLAPRQLAWLAKYITRAPEWVSAADHKACMLCERKFSMFVRRHHCRMCGRICCGPCSKNKRHLPFSDVTAKPNSRAADNQLAKVCSTCITVRAASDDELELANDQVEALLASHMQID
jgi:ankyrin repeat protein